MDAGDVIRFVDRQVYLLQQVLNVYYYLVDPPGGTVNFNLEDLIADFVTRVISNVLPLQNDQLTHVQVEALNMFNQAENATEVINMAGARSTSVFQPLPSFMAINFQLVRDTVATRNGSKRIAGLEEDQVNGNSYTGDAGELEDFQDGLALPLQNVGDVEVAPPVIVRIGPGGVVTAINPIIGATFTKLTSQKTRQVGHGD